MRDVIDKISILFNKNNVVWALGGSLVLEHYGIPTKVNDIDILVSKETMHTALECLNMFGQGVKIPKDGFYKSDFLYKYNVDGTSVDLICGFKVLKDYMFIYDFNEDNITSISGEIHYTSVEEWLIIYDVLGRESKVELIKDYLNKNGVSNELLLYKLVNANKNTISSGLVKWLK